MLVRKLHHTATGWIYADGRKLHNKISIIWKILQPRNTQYLYFSRGCYSLVSSYHNQYRDGILKMGFGVYFSQTTTSEISCKLTRFSFQLKWIQFSIEKVK